MPLGSLPGSADLALEPGGGLLDPDAVAEEDRRAEAPRHPLAGGLENARVGALREHNPFRMALQPLDEFWQQGHGCTAKMRRGSYPVNAARAPEPHGR